MILTIQKVSLRLPKNPESPNSAFEVILEHARTIRGRPAEIVYDVKQKLVIIRLDRGESVTFSYLREDEEAIRKLFNSFDRYDLDHSRFVLTIDVTAAKNEFRTWTQVLPEKTLPPLPENP